MNYYISRGGQQYGPYSMADLQNMLSQGQIVSTDQAWGEGMASWGPVSQIMGNIPPSPAQPRPHQPTQIETPAMPQYQPQPQPYQAPQYVAPGPAYQPYTPSYAPQPAMAGPVPPNIHWILAWLISAIWMWVEVSFVRKIDPKSKALMLMIVAILAIFGGVGVLLVSIATSGVTPESLSNVNTIQEFPAAIIGGFIGYLVGVFGGSILMLVAVFSMRSSIQRYYNTVEPIGLRLSGVMTFFFNVVYFQYHFSRIARWKTTGQLI